jgi:hypothetical protein
MAKFEVGSLILNKLKVRGQDDFLGEEDLKLVFRPRNKVNGEAVYTVPGTYTFIVPEGVAHISALAVGAGGGGYDQWSQTGGGGGALAYADNIPVEAGDAITIVVPATAPVQTSGQSAVVGSFFSAGGGAGQSGGGQKSGGSLISGTIKPKGGRGGNSWSGSAGGGGGAGGYSGNGGNGSYGGSYTLPYNGSGGAAAGGGGYGSSTYGFGGGGGVGIDGEGTSGTWGSLSSQNPTPDNNGNSHYSDLRYSGAGGSGGENGGPNNNSSFTSNWGRTIYHGEGGRYGGGGAGGGTSNSRNNNFCRGGQGAVKIMYSTDSDFTIKNQ